MQTDLPSLDNDENGLLNSTVVFTLIQVWVQEKNQFWQVNYPDLVFVNQDIQ